MKLKVNIADDLAERLETILLERSLTLDELVGLYVRSLCNSIDAGKALGIDSVMPFGKYKGERVGVIAKAEPGYIRYLMGGERPVLLEPEVQELVNA